MESIYSSIECSNLHIGQVVFMSDRPCKIDEIINEDSGDLKIIGLDIFTGEKFEKTCSSTEKLDSPILRTTEYQVISNTDNFLQLMNDIAECREDIKIPEGDLGQKMHEYFSNEANSQARVIVSACAGIEGVTAFWVVGSQ